MNNGPHGVVKRTTIINASTPTPTIVTTSPIPTTLHIRQQSVPPTVMIQPTPVPAILHQAPKPPVKVKEIKIKHGLGHAALSGVKKVKHTRTLFNNSAAAPLHALATSKTNQPTLKTLAGAPHSGLQTQAAHAHGTPKTVVIKRRHMR